MPVFKKEKPVVLPKPSKNADKTQGKLFFSIVLILAFFVSLGTGIAVKFLYNMYKTLPSPSALQDIHPPLVSKVYASDGTLIHEFSTERRFWVPLSDIPQDLQNAVVAIEDRRFYKHWGIDIKRIFGAAVVNVVRGGYSQGASTLTQQLARNIYLSFRSSLIRKIREAMTAVQIESYYTKKEILELYLNQVYLGAGVYGVEAASQRYFSKPVKELGTNECSILAGMIQLPEKYRPDKPKNINRLKRRRLAVLRAMRIMNFITPSEANSIATDTIPVNAQKRVAGTAPYFMEMIRQHIEKRYGEDLLYNGGLEIYSTLDPIAQDSAEQSVAIHLDSLQRRANYIFLDSTNVNVKLGISKQEFLDNFDSLYAEHKEEYDSFADSVKLRIVQTSVIALDVKTGAIKVLIGGRNFRESKFNRATQALRQPGSSIKPIVYTVAIDSGYSPQSVVLDQPITLQTAEGLWRPENYEHEFGGPTTIRRALNKSVNLVAIQVLRDVGASTVIEYARKMGLMHRMNPVPSLAIGACEVTPMEMTSAYSIYPRNGIKLKPYCIDKILDKNGKVLEEHEIREERVLSPQTAFIMCTMLKTVVTHGTGISVIRRGFTRPSAGKTGTTNDYSDAWFVGFTPQMACGVWVGIDERRGMGRGVTGSRGAIPIWTSTMKGLHRNLPVEDFKIVDGVVRKRVCSVSHKLPNKYCPSLIEDYFVEGNLPDSCDIHGPTHGSASGNILRRFGTKKRTRSIEGKRKERRKRNKMMF